MDVVRGPPPIIFEGGNLPQQIIYHWKENLSKTPIHFRYRQNILISRLYEQFLRNAPQRFQKNLKLLKSNVYLLGIDNSAFRDAYERYNLLKNTVRVMKIIFNCK